MRATRKSVILSWFITEGPSVIALLLNIDWDEYEHKHWKVKKTNINTS